MAAPPAPRRGVPLGWKIFLGTAFAVLAAMAVSMWFTYRDTLQAARVGVDQAVAQAGRTANTLLEGQQQTLLRGAKTFADNAVFRDMVLHAKPGSLADQAKEAAERSGANWVQITDGEGMRLARSDMPAAAPISLAGSPLIQAALEGKSGVGYGVASDSTLFQAVAVPVFLPSGKIVGAMMAAKTISDSLALAVKGVTGREADIVFFALDSAGQPHVAASTMMRGAELSVPLAQFIMKWVAPDAPYDQRIVSIAGTEYLARVDALASAGGTRLGGIVALRVRAKQAAGFTKLRNELIDSAIIGIVLAIIISFLLARSITKPVGVLLTAARKAAGGDYSAPPEISSGDEIGELADAFAHLLGELREQQALVNILRTSGERSAITRDSALAAAANAATLVSSRAISVGSLFAGRYQILGVLGTGGMGVVYKATDTQLGETIAIKTLRSDFLGSDPTALERFRSEIKLARRISHRNVVRTHDIGESDGTHFITMEFIAGTSVSDLLGKKKRLPVAAAVTIGKQLARALEVAHEQGIIHRDIKPQNLVVQPDGVLKVMDFGIARLTERPKGVTRTGMVVGTPEYMAPEQLLGDEIDARADIYSAGIVIYECLTGGRPWAADSATMLIGKMLSEPPRAPIDLNPEVPPELSALIVRVLSRDRNERPATAGQLADELENFS